MPKTKRSEDPLVEGDEEESSVVKKPKLSSEVKDEPIQNEHDEMFREDLQAEDEDDWRLKSLEYAYRWRTEQPYDPTAHWNVLYRLKMIKAPLDQVREAREAARQAGLQDEKFWLEWGEEEQGSEEGEGKEERVIQVFEGGIADCGTARIWNAYLDYLSQSESWKEKLKECLDKRLFARDGDAVWCTRDFQFAAKIFDRRLEQLRQEEGEKESFEKRVDLMLDLLSFPHMDVEEVEQKFYQLLSQEGDKESSFYQHSLEEGKDMAARSGREALHIKQAYEFRLRGLREEMEQILWRESAFLAEKEGESRSLWSQYLAYMESKRSGRWKERFCLYNRLLSRFQGERERWWELLDYVKDLPPSSSLSDALTFRFVRSTAAHKDPLVWSLALRKVMKSSEEEEGMYAAFCAYRDKLAALRNSKAALLLWQEWLMYLTAGIKDNSEEGMVQFRLACEEALVFQATHFDQAADPDASIMTLWARVEAGVGNLPEARKLWGDIMDCGHGSEESKWIEYSMMEREYGTAKHARKVFLRAMSHVSDPRRLAREWRTYEAIVGNTQSQEHCADKCLEALREFEKKKWERLQAAKGGGGGGKKVTKPVLKKEGMKVEGREKKVVRFGAQDEESDEEEAKEQKKTSSSKDSHQKSVVSSRPGVHGEAVNHDPSKDNRTVFLSNMDFSVTEQDIREQLKELEGDIEEIRLVRNYKGLSKGYGFLQLKDELSAAKALAMDRTPFKGRPLFVSEVTSRKEERPPAFKFAQGCENSKLFVRGIPFELSDEELKEFFEQFQPVKAARVVRYRNGRSKGLGYVEFNQASEASAALVRTDGQEIRPGAKLEVAISNPPARKAPEGKGYGYAHTLEELGGLKSKKGASHSLGGHARDEAKKSGAGPATRVSFLPRALVAKTDTAAGSKKQAGPTAPPVVGNGPGSTEGKKADKKSNEDFRKLLGL